MRNKEFVKRMEILRPRLLGYAQSLLKNSEEAEDVVQDTLLKLWYIKDNLHKYRSFESIAFVILRNTAINKLKDMNKTVYLDNIPEKIILESDDEEWLDDRIINALNSLPTMEQAVMRMRHLEDMETEEIAKVIGSTPVAIRVALSRARKKMRLRLMSEF